MRTARPEHDLLLRIGRRQLARSDVDEVRSLARMNLDWGYLLATARDHGLVPLLHQNIKTAAPDLVPSQYLATLKRESVANTQSVLHLLGKTVKLTRLLGELNIPHAIFKGPVLSEMAYGEVGLRQAGDIDVLIYPRHFRPVKSLLESLGYQMYPALTPAQQNSHLANHCEIQFMRDDWFTVVDLHWGLTPRSFVFGLSCDEVMSRLQSVKCDEMQVQTFSREDLLIYQTMHGAKHLWRRLEWITSLAEISRLLDSSEWERVLERTLKVHAKRMVGLGLRLAEAVDGTTPPGKILSELDSEGKMQKLAEEVLDQLFITQQSVQDSIDTNLYNIKIMDRKRDALKSSLHAIFVPTLSDWESVSLPGSLHPLYYAVRPLRLSKAYSASLLRKLAHKNGS